MAYGRKKEPASEEAKTADLKTNMSKDARKKDTEDKDDKRSKGVKQVLSILRSKRPD